MSNSISRSTWFPLFFAIILAGGIYLGYKIKSNSTTYLFSQQDSTNPLIESLDLIIANYVEDPELGDKYGPVIEKLLSELDPHSYYIPASDMQGIEDEMTGNFEGIGIEFFIVKDTIQVVTPIQGGPSAQLGILSGDKIITINDSLVAGTKISNDDVIKKLKGPKGTRVKVGVLRNGKNDLIQYDIKRDKIPLYSVDAGFKIDENTGYIKISRFSGQTYNEFAEKLQSLKKQNINQLVIDLRQNPGGYLEEAVKIISEILGKKREVVYIEGRRVPKQSYTAERDGYFLDGKVAILIDEGSASASEILAGAIQDWDRGIIIGRRSFGKGLVQQQYPLSDGSAVRLTIAKYYTPSGRSIQRPYTKGEGDKYEADFQERYDDGELFTQDDNLALAKQDTANQYFTKILKRPVFGGGGIAPDIFIPFDTSYYNAFSIQVLAGGLIQEYTYDYYSKHAGTFSQYASVAAFEKNFTLTDAFYNTFLQYCIKSKGVTHSHLANQKVKKELSLRLKAALARQIFGTDGYLYVLTKDDESIRKALEAFSRKELLTKK